MLIEREINRRYDGEVVSVRLPAASELRERATVDVFFPDKRPPRLGGARRTWFSWERYAGRFPPSQLPGDWAMEI
jgi:hypothetical protein